MDPKSLERLDRAPAVALPTALLYAPAAVALFGSTATVPWLLVGLFTAVALSGAAVLVRSVRTAARRGRDGGGSAARRGLLGRGAPLRWRLHNRP